MDRSGPEEDRSLLFAPPPRTLCPASPFVDRAFAETLSADVLEFSVPRSAGRKTLDLGVASRARNGPVVLLERSI